MGEPFAALAVDVDRDQFAGGDFKHVLRRLAAQKQFTGSRAKHIAKEAFVLRKHLVK